MAVQVPHRTEVKLIAAIVEKHPKVRFAASRTSAHADLYDRMEQALCERVANAVEVTARLLEEDLTQRILADLAELGEGTLRSNGNGAR